MTRIAEETARLLGDVLGRGVSEVDFAEIVDATVEDLAGRLAAHDAATA